MAFPAYAGVFLVRRRGLKAVLVPSPRMRGCFRQARRKVIVPLGLPRVCGGVSFKTIQANNSMHIQGGQGPSSILRLSGVSFAYSARGVAIIAQLKGTC